jgi:aminomethyltransferase
MMRFSVLNYKHIALGSSLNGDKWNDMPVPWSYRTDANDEVIAVRSCAGLFDVSALNLVNLVGRDAESILNTLVAKDVTKLKNNTAMIAAELDDGGAICDDIMLIRKADNAFIVSHGSGKTYQNLLLLSEGKDVKLEQDSDTHVLSLQGPKALEILTPQTDAKLEDLAYFHCIDTTLFGIKVMTLRSGYAAERGYEIYSNSQHVAKLWDKILEVGKPFGAIPASWNCLELTRVEGALQFFPFEMPEGDTTPWEAGLGWAVDLDKEAEYTGKAAVLQARGRERVKQVGLICSSDKAVEIGSKVMKDNIEIGVVTSSSYSRYLMLSLAMIHIKPEYSAIGTLVEVVGSNGSCEAKVAQTPFYDPMRLRTNPERIRS